jgi:hypothetical protein
MDKEYEKLKPYAMMLGSAFQKINFLRDLKDDYPLPGRTIFPTVDMSDFNAETKKALEAEVEAAFIAALEDIKMLPKLPRMGVYLAYTYRRSLLNKIKKTTPQIIINQRVPRSNSKKVSVISFLCPSSIFAVIYFFLLVLIAMCNCQRSCLDCEYSRKSQNMLVCCLNCYSHSYSPEMYFLSI